MPAKGTISVETCIGSQLGAWFSKNLTPDWVECVEALSDLLRRGDAVEQMMQVTGEEGITLEDFVTHQKALMIDLVFLQQDAFDEVDASMPRERQMESFQLLRELVDRGYDLTDTGQAREFFTRLTGLYRNLNYSEHASARYLRYLTEIRSLSERHRTRPKAPGG